MRYEDKIWFSSNATYLSMENASEAKWVEEWFRRMHELYFLPSRQAIEAGHGFASLVLICSAMEAIGTIFYQNTRHMSGKRFQLISELLLGQTEHLSTILYQHYRCGLVHNGRTNQGHFSGFFRRREFSVIDFNITTSILDETFQGSLHKRYSVNPTIIYEDLVKNFNSQIEDRPDVIGRAVKNEYMPDILFLKAL